MVNRKSRTGITVSPPRRNIPLDASLRRAVSMLEPTLRVPLPKRRADGNTRKLTLDQILEIQAVYARAPRKKDMLTVFAEKFRCSESTISRAAYGLYGRAFK